MRKIAFITVAVCMVMSISCKKEKEKQSIASELFIKASRNNTNWLADPKATKIAVDTLQIKGVNSTDNSALVIKMDFVGRGIYLIGTFDSNYTTTDGVSGPTVLYRLDATKTNSVTVSEYDQASHIAKGSFELHFVKVPGSNQSGNNVDMTSGQFWLKIEP